MRQRRSTKVTAGGARFLFFTLAVSVAAINTGNNLFYLLLAMMLSVILMSGIVSEWCLRRLEFRRDLPQLLFLGEPTTATLVVTNRKARLPSFSLSLWDVAGEQDIDRGLTVRQLMPGANQLLTYPFVATKRGRLPLGGVRVGTSFPFGFFLKKAWYPLDGSVLVAPAIHPLDDRLFTDIAAMGQEGALPRKGPGTDLYNIRPYQPGDDSRNIHWLLTARTSKLMVRETEAEQQRRMTILLSTTAPQHRETEFEQAVSLAASMVWALAERRYQIRVVAGSHDSGFGQGDDHVFRLLEILALCTRIDPDHPSLDTPMVQAHGINGDTGATVAITPWKLPSDWSWGLSPDLAIDDPVRWMRSHDI